MSLFTNCQFQRRRVGVGGMTNLIRHQTKGKCREKQGDKPSLVSSLDEKDSFLSAKPIKVDRKAVKVRRKETAEKTNKEIRLVKRKTSCDSINQSEEGEEEELEVVAAKKSRKPSKNKKTFKEEQQDLFSHLFASDSENESIHEETT
jgi:hypothetical protein